MNAVRGSSILVTGGCGFIGCHLVRALREHGASRIVILDSLKYGTSSNLGDLKNEVEIIQFTLGKDEIGSLKNSLKGIDYIFHLAAEKHQQSLNHPIEVIRSNIEGTYSLLNAAGHTGVKRVIFSSSLYVYGRMNSPPFEETETLHPTTIYGTSKAAGEYLLSHAFKDSGLPFNILRFLFIYGPKQFAGLGYKSVIVKNFERILRGESPVVYGDGNQSLDYLYVDDAVSSLIGALQTERTCEVYNVGSGSAIGIINLVNLMLSISGSRLKISFEPEDWTAGSSRVGNIKKIQKELGWRPEITLEEGLRRTYEWMRQQI